MICNLSTTLKTIAHKAEEGFKEVASRLTRNNRIIEAAAVSRQLEFALTQWEISIDELEDAMQYVHLGRTPLNLVSPTMPRELLKNVTVILLEDCVLIAGLRPNNVYLYYEVIQAAMLADVHSFKLVLNVLLKTEDRQYELCKMVVLPTRIFNNTYAQFETDSDYFGVNLLQRTYLSLSEDVLYCRGEDIRICPANQAVYSTEVNACALSLYLQSSYAREMCRRTVTTRPAPSKLERHGSIVLYYLHEPQRLDLQCQRNRSWVTYSVILEGGGILHDAESCYLTLQGLQLHPALRRETEFSTQVPVLFTSTIPAVASAPEKEVLRHMFLNGSNLEQLSTDISSHHIEVDINTLFHLNASALQHASRNNWTAWGLIVAGVVLTLFMLYYFVHFYLENLRKRSICGRDNSVENGA
jgi:hypothetical protein